MEARAYEQYSSLKYLCNSRITFEAKSVLPEAKAE